LLLSSADATARLKSHTRRLGLQIAATVGEVDMTPAGKGDNESNAPLPKDSKEAEFVKNTRMGDKWPTPRTSRPSEADLLAAAGKKLSSPKFAKALSSMGAVMVAYGYRVFFVATVQRQRSHHATTALSLKIG
jgi:hypothetical protein